MKKKKKTIEDLIHEQEDLLRPGPAIEQDDERRPVATY